MLKEGHALQSLQSRRELYTSVVISTQYSDQLATLGSVGTPRMVCQKIWIQSWLYPLKFQCSSKILHQPNASKCRKHQGTHLFLGQKPGRSGRPRSQMAGPVLLAISSFNSWIGIDSHTAISFSSCNKSCRSRPASTSFAKDAQMWQSHPKLEGPLDMCGFLCDIDV